MGNFLDTPITDKETEIGEDAGVNLSYGLSAMQGWRAQMEDDHVQMLRLPAPVSRFFIARLSHSSHRHHFTASSVATPTTTRLPSHPPSPPFAHSYKKYLYSAYTTAMAGTRSRITSQNTSRAAFSRRPSSLRR